MTAEDAKQWLVSRIDYKHEIYLENLSIEENRSENTNESIQSGVKNGRNYLLSVVGIVLSILLGLLSDNKISLLDFYLYLGIDLVCGFIIFIITNKISSYLEEIFGALSEIYVDAQSQISYSRSYFANVTSELDKLNDEQLKNYSFFLPVLLDTTLIPLFITLKKLSMNIFLHQDQRKSIKDNVERLKKEIDSALVIFKKIDTLLLPQDLITYVKIQFAEYEKHSI